MSDTRIIDQNWIDKASNLLTQANSATQEARTVVNSVYSKNNALKNNIAELQAEFTSYQEYDKQQKELTNAKAKIIHVRQELNEKFGVNDIVRQYLTGILEASDLTIVKQRVIDNCTEELMLQSPGYWLTPCLVAIARWLANDPTQANKALQEAITRDDEKTSLLFALICRRVGRMKASATWLERYLAVQDPRQMERKMTTVLDAYSNGFFGSQARQLCADRIDNWMKELSDEPGFVETQQANWETAMYSKVGTDVFKKQFSYASKYCTNWNKLEKTLNETGLNQVLIDYFKGIFEKVPGNNASLNAKLDELLENYITSYDNEELPLRREERMLELIIEEHGRVSKAQEQFDAEQKALEEHFDFTQLLTNAAMHADIIKSSNATQRLSIAISKDWMIAAYNNIVMKIRNEIPNCFNTDIEGWKFDIFDGTEEAQLCAQGESEFNTRRDKELAAVVQSKFDLIIPIICAVVSLVCFISSSAVFGWIGLIAAAGFGLRWYLNKKKVEKTKQEIMEKYEKIVTEVKETVKALCAERVDYIREINERDATSQELCEYLDNIHAEQYVENGKQRNTI